MASFYSSKAMAVRQWDELETQDLETKAANSTTINIIFYTS